ncbi:polysaccharide biosynthesis C-terminal domain-containing protein, partial [Oceanobacillus caeni]
SHVGKKILKVSIPIAVGSITMALVNFIDSLTIPFGLRSIGVDGASDIHYLYGIYGRGLALVQIATVFATSIVLPLIPLLTEKLVNHDRNGMRTTIEKAFYMANLIAWPAAFGLLALTLPMNVGLFSDLEGSTMLAIIGFSSVFTSLTVLGTGILQGMNLANQAAYIILIGIVVKTFSNIFLVHLFGLNGA